MSKKLDIVEKKCKLCHADFTVDQAKSHQTQYHQYGYCSNNCYAKSGEKQLQRRKTTLINHGILFDENDLNDINEKYSLYCSEKTKSCVSKWKQTHIERYGSNFAQTRAYKGWETNRKQFLINNNIVTEEQYKNLTDTEINDMFKDNFNNITKHGELIKKGRLNKYNNDEKLYKQSYIDGIRHAIENYIKSVYTEDYLNKLSEDEYQEIYNESYKYYVSTRKKGKKSEQELLEWKKAHLINLGFDKNFLDTLSVSDINKKYSEYISGRISKLSETLYNGYKHTKKGWYEFKKFKPLFYRSSWELKVCELLDTKFSSIIINIETPEPIPYILNEQRHSYFCDFKITFNNNKILYIEVKPLHKMVTDMNRAKLKEAKLVWGKNFMVATENEIFSNELEKNILKYYND